MKKFLLVLIACFFLAGFAGVAGAVQIVDTVQWNTGYFLDDEVNVGSSPYYRWADQDWGWTHSALTDDFTSATLFISAWDVDLGYSSYGDEIDNIYAYDNDGNMTLLGHLTPGNSNYWGYTEFTLDVSLFDEAIANGLQVFMDIDVNNEGWAVTLAKSVLTLDGANPPNPNPGSVPEPATMLLLGTGLAGLAGFGRKLKK